MIPILKKAKCSSFVKYGVKLNLGNTCCFSPKSETGYPREEMAQGNLIFMYKYMKEGCKDSRVKLFSVVSDDRTGGNRHKLKHLIVCTSGNTLLPWGRPGTDHFCSFQNVPYLNDSDNKHLSSHIAFPKSNRKRKCVNSTQHNKLLNSILIRHGSQKKW